MAGLHPLTWRLRGDRFDIARGRLSEVYVSVKGSEAAWRERPVAITSYQTLVAADESSDGSWQRVTKLMDADPGDTLAYRKKTLNAD